MVRLDDIPCAWCGDTSGESAFVLCDGCPNGGHLACLGLRGVPKNAWFCAVCADGGEGADAPRTRVVRRLAHPRFAAAAARNGGKRPRAPREGAWETVAEERELWGGGVDGESQRTKSTIETHASFAKLAYARASARRREATRRRARRAGRAPRRETGASRRRLFRRRRRRRREGFRGRHRGRLGALRLGARATREVDVRVGSPGGERRSPRRARRRSAVARDGRRGVRFRKNEKENDHSWSGKNRRRLPRARCSSRDARVCFDGVGKRTRVRAPLRALRRRVLRSDRRGVWRVVREVFVLSRGGPPALRVRRRGSRDDAKI